jgi:hypothetical protein
VPVLGLTRRLPDVLGRKPVADDGDLQKLSRCIYVISDWQFDLVLHVRSVGWLDLVARGNSVERRDSTPESRRPLVAYFSFVPN